MRRACSARGLCLICFSVNSFDAPAAKSPRSARSGCRYLLLKITSRLALAGVVVRRSDDENTRPLYVEGDIARVLRRLLKISLASRVGTLILRDRNRVWNRVLIIPDAIRYDPVLATRNSIRRVMQETFEGSKSRSIKSILGC